MEAIDRKFNNIKNRNGSALVMVIVLTVLLSLIASMFILMSRVDEMSTKSIKTDRQLAAAVDVLVEKIEDVLVYDLYAMGSTRLSKSSNVPNEAWDYPKHNTGVGPDLLSDTFDDSVTWFADRDDDKWLANLEPEMIDMVIDMDTVVAPAPLPPLPTIDYGFRHITDLYGTFAQLFDKAYNYYSGPGGGTSFGPNVDQEGDRISMRNLRAVILDTDAPINEGDKADADGEGVSDSRWFVIPNMKTQKGENFYAAVRIIDNGAMINANTAYRNPEDPLIMTNPGSWDGSQLSHVNLEGITDTIPAKRYDAALIQGMRYGTVVTTPVPGALDFDDYLNDIEYEVNVARRLSDPKIISASEMFLPFDIGDELELRNRFFLTTSFDKIGSQSRLYQDGDLLANPQALWRLTFNPQGDPGRGLPFGVRSTDTIGPWYDKVGPDDIDDSNRRHYTTVLNNEKELGRFDDGSVTVYPASMDITDLNEEQKIGITLPLEIKDCTATTPVIENYIKRLAMGIYRGLPDDADIKDRFGSDSTNKPIYTREQLAWQMAINMVDYQDANSIATETATTIKLGNTTYYGTESIDALKKNTICISKIGYRDRTTGAGLLGKYYGIEVFNPDDDNTPAGSSTVGSKDDLSNYKIIIADINGNYKGEFYLSGSVKDSGSLDGFEDTLAFLFNDSGRDLNTSASSLVAFETRSVLVTPTPIFGISAGDKVILFDDTLNMPVDSVTVPTDMKTGQLDVLDVRFRRTVLPGTNFLLPATSSGISPWEVAPNPNVYTRLGDILDPDPDGNATEAELIDPKDSTAPNIQELEFISVQLAGADQQLSNIGEIENVLAVGTRYMFNDKGTPADKTDDEIECTTLIQAIAESLVVQLNSATPAPGDTTDQEAGIEMKTFGRISLNDLDYQPLLDSLTYFDPARDGVDLHNIVEGIPIADITVTPANSLDPLSGLEDTIADGLFLSRYTSDPLHNDEIYWTNLATLIEIDLGGSFDIYGIIVQTGDNDEYLLEYDDGTGYKPLWTVESSLGGGGLQTSPDPYDDGKWHLLSTSVSAEKIRISAVSGDGFFSVSEIQIGVNIGSYEPYFYGDNIAGRININTAPWYVINQLPWVEDISATEPGSLAQAIVAFRDKAATPLGAVDYSGDTGRFDITDITGISEEPGFTDIVELLQVINKDSVTDTLLEPFDIRKNIFDGLDAVDGDYTLDGIEDDFEERNLIFQRISNLVTVRSDVFTAYILVRIGTDGPQRRMMAIFDRSEVKSATDKPKLLAIQPVPDPR